MRISTDYHLRVIAVCTAVLALSACQTTSSAAGMGDVELSKEVASAFIRDYMNHPYPEAFAISTGGKYYNYYYCSGPRCSTPGGYIHKTIESCERKGNLPCKLFALKKEIVWTKASGDPYTLDDVYAVLGLSREDRLKEQYANLSNFKLCEGALADDGHGWSEEHTRRRFVAEARSLDMKPDFCARLLDK